MTIEEQLWAIVLELERDVEEMTKAGLLPLRLPPAEQEALRQRMIADYEWVGRKADEAAERAVAEEDFNALGQSLEVAGQARLNRDKLG